jgi:hypothetical protein
MPNRQCEYAPEYAPDDAPEYARDDARKVRQVTSR